MTESEYGTIDSWDFQDFPTALERNQYFAENYFLKHIKAIKTCNPVTSDCWTKPLSIDGGVFFTGTYLSSSESRYSAFITASGYSVLYWLHASGSGGWFWIDINGPRRGPNVVGKDVFPFGFGWGNSQGRKLGFLPKGIDFYMSEKISR